MSMNYCSWKCACLLWTSMKPPRHKIIKVCPSCLIRTQREDWHFSAEISLCWSDMQLCQEKYCNSNPSNFTLWTFLYQWTNRVKHARLPPYVTTRWWPHICVGHVCTLGVMIDYSPPLLLCFPFHTSLLWRCFSPLKPPKRSCDWFAFHRCHQDSSKMYGSIL